ncbi:MAG: transcriptional regulator NrdR [Rickettsiales bacterium]|jgi:transcriptional repressor NrdR|nr:transcriptional regulator NrdR [Rickettsiales bacterium]
MKCPICGSDDTFVTDTRDINDGKSIKRRRECSNCSSKFTTIEEILKKEIFVLKKDGVKELFDRDKLYNAIFLSSGKRLSNEQIVDVLNGIYAKIDALVATEIKSSMIAEIVLDNLERVDKIAYLRFACIYMKLETFDDISNLIKKLSN